MCLFILVPKLSLPESRFASNKGDSISASSEKNAKAEPKAEAVAKARSSSNTPTSPKPPLQSAKPSLAGRPTVPQKPRSASRTGEELLGTSEWSFCEPWRRHPGLHSEQKLNVDGFLRHLLSTCFLLFHLPLAIIQMQLFKTV